MFVRPKKHKFSSPEKEMPDDFYPSEQDRREQFEQWLLADLDNLSPEQLNAVIFRCEELLNRLPVPEVETEPCEVPF